MIIPENYLEIFRKYSAFQYNIDLNDADNLRVSKNINKELTFTRYKDIFLVEKDFHVLSFSEEFGCVEEQSFIYWTLFSMLGAGGNYLKFGKKLCECSQGVINKSFNVKILTPQFKLKAIIFINPNNINDITVFVTRKIHKEKPIYRCVYTNVNGEKTRFCLDIYKQEVKEFKWFTSKRVSCKTKEEKKFFEIYGINPFNMSEEEISLYEINFNS